MEESVLKNAWKKDYAKNGFVDVLQSIPYENSRNVSSVSKEKEAALPLVQHASMDLLKEKEVAKVNVHVDVHRDEGTISRNDAFSNGSKEREESHCPLDKRLPVNTFDVASQGTSVHATSSHADSSALHSTRPAHPLCMAAGKVGHLSITTPHTSATCNILDVPNSKLAVNFSGKIDKGEGNKDNHVTPTPLPQNFTENCSSTEDTLGQATSKPSSYLEAAKRNVYFNLEENAQQGKTSQAHDSSSNNDHIFKIDQGIIQKRMELCRFSILGKITLAKGEEPWTWFKLKEKLDSLWKLNSPWRLISIGKGFFQIILTIQEDYDKVWSKEALVLNPGVLRLQCWKFGFDPSMDKNSKAQVWIRFFQLPWCLWDTSVLWGIASKIGQPIKIDKQTLEGNFGHYARILIEVDLTKSITSSVLVDCNHHVIEVQVSPESMPNFCTGCNVIGHPAKDCRRSVRVDANSIHSKSVDPQWPVGSKRERMEIGMDLAIRASTSKRNVQQSEWRKKKVQVRDNEKVQLASIRNNSHAIVETVTDFSTHGGSHPPYAKKLDPLDLSNQFSALETKVDSFEMMVETSLVEAVEKVVETPQVNQEFDASSFIQEFDVKDGENDEGFDQKSGDGDENEDNHVEVNIDLPKVPPRWSDLIDEDDLAENTYPIQEGKSSNMEGSSIFEKTYGSIPGFGAKLQEDCIWLNPNDDHKYDRDMCVEIERYKNSAKATRNFIANLPKKDKKVKIALRQPQRKATPPKD